MFERLGSLPRRLRWALHKWNPAADREFHDALFGAQRYDPFSFAYPGYITIRRFAELTEPHLEGVRRAVDLGCGPGEITCELARRNPDISFVGVDHSEAAIARAREHQASLALMNIEFRAGDVSAFTPNAADIVLMYDSFHHLLDPAAFVRTLKPLVPKFVLIEPAGDWLGGWQKTLEFDWVPLDIDAIRARLEWQLNVDTPPDATTATDEEKGEPVEHRYTMSDLQTFFEGYGLAVRGTIAGIGEYPPNPYATSILREDFGRIAADTLAAIENLLVKHDLDLHAKHWVIVGERDTPHRLRTPRAINPRTSDPPERLQGAHDVEYGDFDGPTDVAASTILSATLTLTNRSWRPWSSDSVTSPVLVSYHWLTADGTMAVEDGRRSPLPRTLLPGETLAMTLTVEAPQRPESYILAVDLVEEGVTWFSRAGAPMLRIRIRVRATSAGGPEPH